MDSFAPGRKVSQTQLEAVGLGHLYGSVSRGVTLGEAKIDGRSGVLMTPNLGDQPAPITSYCPGSQTWINHGRIMIGWETDFSPTAEVLAKPIAQQVPSTFVLPAADTVWTIPVARSSRGHAFLPTYYEWPEEGPPVQKRRPDFDWLWQIACEVWDYWNTEGGNGKPEEWLAEVALKVLQVNYYIGRPELTAFAAMGKILLDKVNVAVVCMILIDGDFPKAVEESKKNEAD